MTASLRGKTLFISGGSRGIGLAIALRAGRDGANVAIAAKTGSEHPTLPGTIYSAAEALTSEKSSYCRFSGWSCRIVSASLGLMSARTTG
jgi:NAD(P)-dependent dehydrogenase (short-subunit alcohol dehydrogenase family)